MRATVVALLCLLVAPQAALGSTEAERCEAAKLERTGEYAQCLLRAESIFARTDNADLHDAIRRKCEAKFAQQFERAEQTWGTQCPTVGDAAEIQEQVNTDAEVLSKQLAGVPATECVLPVPECGNGMLEAGETCELGSVCSASYCIEGSISYVSHGGTCVDCLRCAFCVKRARGTCSSLNDPTNPNSPFCPINTDPTAPPYPFLCEDAQVSPLNEVAECVGEGCATDGDCPAGFVCEDHPANVFPSCDLFHVGG